MGDSRKDKSNRSKELTLLGLFGSEALENLEKRLADATDFSFSIIDYKGRAVVKDYKQQSYEEYMNKMKEDTSCQMQAAFAAAKSAITNRPYIYLCHCGLIKAAIPIILKEQYLGAVICGFVRCDDTDYLDPLTKTAVIQKDFPVEEGHILEESYQHIPLFQAKKIQSIANLVFYMVNELCQKENYAIRMGDEERSKIHIQTIRRQNDELKAKMDDYEAMSLKANMFPQTLLNMLVTISSIAIVEEANMTQEMIVSLSSILRYYIEYHKGYISLEKELEQVKNFLEVIRLRYENRVNLDFSWPKEIKEQMIPKLIILPLVEYIVNFGIFNQSFLGTIHNKVECISDRCIISFSLEYSGEMADVRTFLKESGNIINDRLLNEQLSSLEKRLAFEYGEDYSMKFEPNLVILDIPKD